MRQMDYEKCGIERQIAIKWFSGNTYYYLYTVDICIALKRIDS